jgi:hypothetical protein
MRTKMLALAFSCALSGAAGCSATPETDLAATPASAPATSAAATPSVTASAGDFCPPDVNLMYYRLQEAKELVAKIDKSLTGIQEPTCSEGWAMARTVVTKADPVLVLFKHEPTTGRWLPVAVGTDNICDAFKVPAAVQTKLGAGC